MAFQQGAPTRPKSANVTGFKDLKIIHAGFHRAGTTSLCKMLDALGFGPVWHAASFQEEDIETWDKGLDWWVQNDVLKKLNRGESSGVDFQEWLDIIKCPTVMDFPINFHWDALHKQYPDAKVILSIRDFESWYHSNAYLVRRCCKSFIIRNFGQFLYPWIDFMRNDYFVAHYDNDVDFLLNEKNMAAVKTKYYDAHIAKVKRLVPKDQLLIYDIRDGWEPLCSFLNVQIPDNKEVPRVNGKKAVDDAFIICEQMVVQTMMKIAVVSATMLYTAVSVIRNIRKS